MIPWPVLRRELKASAIRRDLYGFRMFLAVLLGLVVAITALIVLQGDILQKSVFPAEGLKNFGKGILIGVGVVQLMTLAFLVPSLVGGAIAEDRERDTLQFLLLTRLTRLEITLAKLAGRLAPAFSLTLVGVPFVAFASYLAGFFPELGALVVGGMFSTTLMMGAISLSSSSRHLKAGNARAEAKVLVWGWLIFSPVLAFVPLPANPYGAFLVWPIREFGRWVGPSSPVTLILNWQWVTGRWLPALADRAQTMVLTQAALTVLAIGSAVWGLKRHEPRRAKVDPSLDGRPPCGDDPIYWREYLLPQRSAANLRPLNLLKSLIALARLLLVVLFRLAVVLLIVAVPIALIKTTATMAVPAFQERWISGSGTTARDDLTWMLQAVSGFLGFLCMLTVTGNTANKTTTDREKGTWDQLLTTPLEGHEILGSKLRATASGLRPIAPVLGPLWLVGLVCGSLHPVGVVLAGLDLCAALCLGLALGTWLGIRPGATSTANSLASFGALAITGVHVPYLLLALAPARFLSGGFDEWTPAHPAVLAAGMILAPTVTTWLAYRLTRRAFVGFDRYVDRPCRGAAGPPT